MGGSCSGLGCSTWVTLNTCWLQELSELPIAYNRTVCPGSQSGRVCEAFWAADSSVTHLSTLAREHIQNPAFQGHTSTPNIHLGLLDKQAAHGLLAVEAIVYDLVWCSRDRSVRHFFFNQNKSSDPAAQLCSTICLGKHHFHLALRRVAGSCSSFQW